VPAIREVTIYGHHTGEEPIPLSSFCHDAYGALVDAFEVQRVNEYTERNPELPSVMIQTQPGSDLVLGRFIERGDTLFTRRWGTLGFAPNSSTLEEGAWIQGAQIYSAAWAKQQGGEDLDGHPALILPSLDLHGQAMPDTHMAGVEVERTALSGLYITTKNLLPRDATGGPAALFNPEFYL